MPVHINYEAFNELCGRKITNETLHDIAGYSAQSFSQWRRSGRAFPGDAIYKIAEHMEWDAQQLRYYLLNGPVPVYKEPREIIQINVDDLLEIVERRKIS